MKLSQEMNKLMKQEKESKLPMEKKLSDLELLAIPATVTIHTVTILEPGIS